MCIWRLSFLRLPILKREMCLVFNVNFWILINATVSLQMFYWSLLLKSKALVVLFSKSFKYSWVNEMCSYEEIFVLQIDYEMSCLLSVKRLNKFLLFRGCYSCFNYMFIYTVHWNWKKYRAMLPVWHFSWLKSGMFSLIKNIEIDLWSLGGGGYFTKKCSHFKRIASLRCNCCQKSFLLFT